MIYIYIHIESELSVQAWSALEDGLIAYTQAQYTDNSYILTEYLLNFPLLSGPLQYSVCDRKLVTGARSARQARERLQYMLAHPIGRYGRRALLVYSYEFSVIYTVILSVVYYLLSLFYILYISYNLLIYTLYLIYHILHIRYSNLCCSRHQYRRH